jgi:hypothetical protein
MAVVNFSVPEKVKRMFNAAFAGRNKSASIAELMVRAVEEHKARLVREKAIDRLLARRETKRSVTNADVEAVRQELRA